MSSADWEKDPDATLDYKFDWSRWLAGGETITTSTMTVSAGITLTNQTNTTTQAVAWVSGGVSGQPYKITNHIVTSGGRTDDRTITIRVTNR